MINAFFYFRVMILGVREDLMVLQRGNESVAQEICLLGAVPGVLEVAAP